MNAMKPHHNRSSLADALACWLLRTAASEWWPVLALRARHFPAREGASDGMDARRDALRGAGGVLHRLMRQRRAGVTRPQRVAPRSARDRM